jgi:signal transduction histidine kinase
LGLSIAKTIVENSGGTITAESANSVTTFTVKLRVQKSSAH